MTLIHNTRSDQPKLENDSLLAVMCFEKTPIAASKIEKTTTTFRACNLRSLCAALCPQSLVHTLFVCEGAQRALSSTRRSLARRNLAGNAMWVLWPSMLALSVSSTPDLCFRLALCFMSDSMNLNTLFHLLFEKFAWWDPSALHFTGCSIPFFYPILNFILPYGTLPPSPMFYCEFL